MVDQYHTVNITAASQQTVLHSKFFMWVITLITSLCFATSVSAKSYSTSGANTQSNELNVTVDRTQIYENETLELKAVGHLEIALDFSNLFNLRNLELPAPDTTGLSDDFDIIDQQQKYNIQSVNGQNNASITWTYTLSPKRIGNLTIPSIHYKDQQSNPITVKVLKGNSNAQSGRPPLVFLEAELDKQTAHVQEQLTYTLRLYYADSLVSGDLSSPTLDNAIVEQLGDQKKYYRMRNNLRYEVIERQYLIFPQQSGELTIAEQTFSGTIIDSRARKRKHIRERSPSLLINIRPPASTFSGKTWLPAMSLNLSEKWDTTPDNIAVGDSFTRTISIQALGLLGSTLPPITVPAVAGFKQYPDQPQTESMQHQAGVQSTRTESIAMVAIAEGTTTLPEIRIPWWDTANQVERVAIIPSREITISPSAGSPESSPTPPKTQQSNDTSDNVTPSIESETENQGTEAATTLDTNIETATNNTLLYVIILLLVMGWLATTTFLLKRRVQTNETISAPVHANADEQAAFTKLTASIEQHSPMMLAELLQWAKLTWPNIALYSVTDVKQHVANEEFSALIDDAEKCFYAKDNSTTWDSAALLTLLNKLRVRKDTTGANAVLPNLYQQQ